MRSLTHGLVLTFGLVLLGTPASAVVLSPGDIVINTTEKVVRVDPATGASEVIADTTSCSALSIFAGAVEAVALEASGDVLVVTDGSGPPQVILRIDPADGSCSDVAGNGVGGTIFSSPVGGMVVVPAAPLIGASAISDWGIALLFGILLGLSLRLGPRSLKRQV